MQSNNSFQSFSTLKGEFLPTIYPFSSEEKISEALLKANEAVIPYGKTSFVQRADFLETIAQNILALGEDLLMQAHLETALPIARLTGERDRTINQLKLFASLLREGSWVDAVIDTALPDRKPLPRADIRRMLQPIGPVLVFGASNFPFAYSTAGVDTASALAAGCPVIVKAHESHLGTNEMVASAIKQAIDQTKMPLGTFDTLIGEGPVLGQQLATNELIKAIGFTGSYKAGMALYTTATQKRKTPIPVYAEMSSINPIVLLPKTLEEKVEQIATTLSASILLGVGQFCTSPGLIFVIESEAANRLKELLAHHLKTANSAVMLNQTISKAYYTDQKKLIGYDGVTIIIQGQDESSLYKATPTLLSVNAAHFITEPLLQKEVFGPCSMIVVCKDQSELNNAIMHMHGQLTGSFFGNTEELEEYNHAIDLLQQRVGRIVFNNVPTGVEVCNAMVHGGPFPSTTDGRTTSVGPEAIKRFVRPVCYQDCPDDLLPVYLRNKNEAGINRNINGVITNVSIK
ncbi:MAG: aldehyde dehydrogenase (NADP(+)) [Sphingobacteriia bacterium]|nr:MAG: aldehyde dehydrogenase (NADP(+)) [Sphingobacteriia bacterium]